MKVALTSACMSTSHLAPPPFGGDLCQNLASATHLSCNSRHVSPEVSQVPMCSLSSRAAGTDRFVGQTRDALSLHIASSFLADPEGQCDSQRKSRQRTTSVCGKAKRTLLVAYFPRCATEEDLGNAFASAGIGAPCWASIMRDKTGLSKCFAFVEFSSHELAREAIRACANGCVCMHDHTHKVWHLKTEWARADRKGGKKASLQGAMVSMSSRWQEALF